MGYIAVDKTGEGHIFNNPPSKNNGGWWSDGLGTIKSPNTGISLPKWAIKVLTGKDLTWNDNYVSLSDEKIKNLSSETIDNGLKKLIQYDNELKKFVYSDVLKSFLNDLLKNHVDIHICNYSHLSEYYDVNIEFKE